MPQTSPTLRHPPKPRLTVRVGVTGHRPNKLGAVAVERIQRQLPVVYRAIENVTAKVFRENAAYFAEEPPVIRLVSGFAEGVDQMAATATPATWQVEALLPFPIDEYLKDFEQSATGDGRDVSAEFVDSLKRATTVTQLPDPRPHDRNRSYADVGGYLLRQIDVLIAVWDGEPPKPGGTGAVAREAVDGRIPVIWLLTTGDRPPRLLTGFDAAGNPVASDADCTDGPLAAALDPVFAAPAPTSNPDTRGSARECLRRYLDEHWRARSLLSAYDFLKRIVNFQWPNPVVRSPAFDARMREWDAFIAAAPDAANLRTRLAEVLLPRFIWADTLAVHFSHLYRSAYVMAYFLSAVAVFIALGGLFFDSGHDALKIKAILVTLELVVIGWILAMIVIGRRRLWHERWLDYRGLAENLRHGRFLAFVSEFGRIRSQTPGGDERQPPWFLWYLRATMREIGLPNAKLDATYQWRLLDATLTHEIDGPDGQLAYHRANSKNARQIDHRLHQLGVGCFILTFIVLLVFLAGYLLGPVLGLDSGAHEAGGADPLVWAKPWVTFLAACLPALGAALAGIRVQGDFESSHDRSEAMLDAFEELAQDYRTAESRRIDLEETARMLIVTAQTMSEDVDAWQELYGRKRLTLPA